MSKILTGVAIVAGVVAVVATGGAALAGAGAFLGMTASTLTAVSAIAGAVSAAASIAARATAKPPPVRGSLSQITIGRNMPMLCALGRTYSGGSMVHDVAYGPTLKKVPNPYRSMIFVWSIGLVTLEAVQADFQAIDSYYNGWLTVSTQAGAKPEATALSGPYGAIPDWGSDYRLSGMAAGIVTAKFDRDGKRFASGLPQFGAICKELPVYDCRQDDTYSGGSGNARAADEDTWVTGAATYNPSCHAASYALGRTENGKKVFGCGFDPDSIDWPAWTGFANVCDANGWQVNGLIWEPGSRWNNLRRICAAGGGVPLWVGGKLTVNYVSPKVAIDTIEASDIVEGTIRIPAMLRAKDRLNGIVPRYISEDHKWEMVQSDLVSIAEYVTADGEEREEEVGFELVSDKNQGAQLGAYQLVDQRELAPILLPLGPRFLRYSPGNTFSVGATLAADTGLPEGMLLTMVGRAIDPVSATVNGTFESETPEKHPFALGQTGSAPPIPTLFDPEAADIAAARTKQPAGYEEGLIKGSFTSGLTITATDTTATVSAHQRVYSNMVKDIDEFTITGLTAETAYSLYYDDPDLEGGDVTIVATTGSDSFNTPANPDRHRVGTVTTDVNGGGGTSGGGSTPPDWNGGGSIP